MSQSPKAANSGLRKDRFDKLFALHQHAIDDVLQEAQPMPRPRPKSVSAEFAQSFQAAARHSFSQRRRSR